MDTSDLPALGRLAVMSAQLGAQNRRVAAAVDAQLDEVERLFRAAAEGDWESMLQLSERLASREADSTVKLVVRAARKACEALGRDPSCKTASRRVCELLTACREAKARRGE
jgi:hypothetical protein